MKKLLLLTLCCVASGTVQAQTTSYSYANDRVEQGYNPPYTAPSNGYAANTPYARPSTPAPTSAQAYGFYQQPVQQPTYQPYVAQQPQQRQMTWYPTQQQRAEASGQPYVYAPYGSDQDYAQEYVSRSPVYNSKAVRNKRPYYADLHLGIGGTTGWDNNFDDPVGPIWGIAVGTRLSPTVRVEAAFDYHVKAKLAKSNGKKIEYKQYALGANVYYDFPVNAGMGVQPFVGAGIWAVDGKASAKYNGEKIAGADSDIKLGVSVSGGIVYPINEMFSAVAMARVRYINVKEDLFNIQGLVGLRYHF